MADNDLPPKLSDPSAVPGMAPIDQNTTSEAGKRPFADYMREEPQVKAQQAPSPMQALTPQTNISGPPTMDSVQEQMKATSSQLGDINQKLNTPNLKLKPSEKFLVRSKLEDAHTNIREAAQKVGVDTGPQLDTKGLQNPIAKFLALIGDGQQQLESAQTMIAKYSENGQVVNPGELLLAQIKINRAQQQLDFSSIVLAKAIEGIKTLFNVQI
jgi:hypothetical protein